MLSNRVFSFFSIIFLFLVTARTQTWTPIENWKYIPQDDIFWNQYENISGKKNLDATLEFMLERAKNKDISILDDAEYYVALADSLVASGYRQAAFNLYFTILKKHPGSFLSQKSLVDLSLLITADESTFDEYDEEELSRVINQAAFKDVPDSVAGMVYYYSGMDDLNRKLTKWSQISLKNIKKDQFWSDRLLFYSAIQLYSQGNVEAAEKELRDLAEKPNLSAKLRWRAQLQRARILFEQKKFAQADEIYKKTNFPARVFGKVLLERAWTKFYLKEYSTALGLLESLKAPAFNYASDPEQYILSMVIYREVCHYPKVAMIAEEFQKKFKNTFETIVANKPLKDNLVLVWQSIQRPGYRESSNIIDTLIKEKALLTSILPPKNSSPMAQLIYGLYQSKEQDLGKRLERFMKKDLRLQADTFLLSWDQIKLADYISKLDEFRIKPLFENRRYVANTEELKSLNTLYWPVSGEYWKEEFEHYQVLLSDRCDGAAQTPKGGN